jgi:hypothetical protein
MLCLPILDELVHSEYAGSFCQQSSGIQTQLVRSNVCSVNGSISERADVKCPQ